MPTHARSIWAARAAGFLKKGPAGDVRYRSRSQFPLDTGKPCANLAFIIKDREAAASSVAMGFVDVMCRVASVSDCITFPASVTEPFSLNLARRAAEELRVRGVRSVLMVTAVHCQPVFGDRTPDNWFNSNHGMEEIALQIAKLLYYRLGVMPSIQRD